MFYKICLVVDTDAGFNPTPSNVRNVVKFPCVYTISCCNLSFLQFCLTISMLKFIELENYYLLCKWKRNIKTGFCRCMIIMMKKITLEQINQFLPFAPKTKKSLGISSDVRL
ncbi:hypothetical protein Patl1_26142 [Pistacia atlantica]|uniref:Uncharacterized protein n=1 Tax=Pistacia atlantica TaxID=434234 RepID=A0ACC1B060_9ROSI|nr:hypothetical protein Patl1_26142 [Pistacia atlantica]